MRLSYKELNGISYFTIGKDTYVWDGSFKQMLIECVQIKQYSK